MGATVLLSFMKRFCTIKSSFLTQQQWYRLITSDLELASAISMIVLSPVMRRTASWVSSCFGGLFSLSTPEVRSVCPEPGIVRQLTFVSKYLFFVDFVGSHMHMEPSRGKRGIRYTLFWPQQEANWDKIRSFEAKSAESPLRNKPNSNFLWWITLIMTTLWWLILTHWGHIQVMTSNILIGIWISGKMPSPHPYSREFKTTTVFVTLWSHLSKICVCQVWSLEPHASPL